MQSIAAARLGREATLPAAGTGSFERLFKEEYARVVSVAYRVLGDRAQAEDVAQEVFLQLHRRRGQELASAPAWLHAAAVHRALNVLRDGRRRARRELLHAEVTAAMRAEGDPARLVEDAAQLKEVRSALDRLSRKSATVLALRYGGLSYAEVAAALGVRVGQIGTLLRRAEEALRREVKA
jgi:RNA polymerase sigma-70 factor (ECF subfamily)